MMQERRRKKHEVTFINRIEEEGSGPGFLFICFCFEIASIIVKLVLTCLLTFWCENGVCVFFKGKIMCYLYQSIMDKNCIYLL